MRPRQFDHIAFDWDGTLFDSTALIARCIQAAVRDVGGTVPSDQDASYCHPPCDLHGSLRFSCDCVLTNERAAGLNRRLWERVPDYWKKSALAGQVYSAAGCL
ncbi:MAG: phosphoglycolate phosphatase-like HAD superfamily hydrolase [Marinobacter psychrophilus]|jgi:phosphoglycolate phosphatase-like HAD superfamily hydrolase